MKVLALLMLLLGIAASAVSFVFIRESTEPPVMLAAWRVLLAALLLSPVYLLARRRHGDASPAAVLGRSLLPGAILAAHFVSWVIGVRLTGAANATLIVNLLPLAMPPLMWLMFRERLSAREAFATLLALTGLWLLAREDLEISRSHLVGDVICLLSMVLFAVYLALARRFAALPSLWLYVVPMYAVAGVVALAFAIAAIPWLGSIRPQWQWANLLNVFALAAISTVIGHSALNFGMQRLRGQTVTVLNMLQFVIAGAVAWWLYAEVPGPAFYQASALLILGVALVSTQRLNP